MPPPTKLNLRSKLDDNELDLSMMELTEVPVKEIAAIPKASFLDLSNNRLMSLGSTFAPILAQQLVKLDLSKNTLRDLPDNFGDLRSLRHLDLDSNRIERLPLSFSRLVNLRWLDLKSNPLVPPLREKAGDCLDAGQCQRCARDVVAFLQTMQLSYDQRLEELLREHSEMAAAEVAAAMVPNQPKPKPKQRKSKKKKSGNADDLKQHHNGNTADGSDTPDQCDVPATRSFAYTTGKGKNKPTKKPVPPNSLQLTTPPPASSWLRSFLKVAFFVASIVIVTAILEPNFHAEVAVQMRSWASRVFPGEVVEVAGTVWSHVGTLGKSEWVEGTTRVVRSGVANGVESLLGHRPLLRDGLKRIVEGAGDCLATLRQWVLGW